MPAPVVWRKPPFSSGDSLKTKVRVWNVVRSQGEIAGAINHPLQGNEPGLVGYWPLDGDAQDASGHGHHGTVNGNVTFVADRQDSPESAANFPNDRNAYIDLGQPPELLKANFSI